MATTDPRLAALYDIDNPAGADHEYWRRFALDVGAETIVDLGCGTGLLTVTLTGGGRRVIGIDPDDGMLSVARQRPGGSSVEWRLGDSRCICEQADVVLMTGNVAQHIGPRDWGRTLSDIARWLRPAGIVGFETRNPRREAWRTWTPERTRSTRDTGSGELTEWLEVTEPDAHGTVVLTAHNVWSSAPDEDVVVTQPLTFRSLEAVEADLEAVGLTMRSVHGGWRDEPFDEVTSDLIVVAAQRAASQPETS